ncbi:vWA domain-containing protein [Amycolatopsis pithecellobii]|uniref:VWA domain-containing protein n=1 Tax=Amycolatopsis pithecellobii TaxID=664692 RepID=A0A6N7Z3T2_9PSEU|nr:VWA domain-containing protein [Amycolatopsis pithecellobii]MTD54794.1 VWA domain-containing protein [Amycolatopsis pithecellobii]
MTQSTADEVSESTLTDGQVIMPFYLIVDVSSSMSGDIQELNEAIQQLIRDICDDPVVDDLVMLSIITFNHNAQTIVPLDSPSSLTPPTVTASGGTNYGAAFREYHQVFEQDRAKLKSQRIKMYRPCVFFLTDGAPGDGNYAETFQSLFAYDPEQKTGNRAFPYFVPFGFRSAPEEVMRKLAYPNFGRTKGRWFLSRSNSVKEVLKAMTEVIGKTVISSGQSASQGLPQIVPPAPSANLDAQFGEAEDWM